jgi:hypothetical protein
MKKFIGDFSEEHPMYDIASGMPFDVSASMAEEMFTEKSDVSFK